MPLKRRRKMRKRRSKKSRKRSLPRPKNLLSRRKKTLHPLPTNLSPKKTHLKLLQTLSTMNPKKKIPLLMPLQLLRLKPRLMTPSSNKSKNLSPNLREPLRLKTKMMPLLRLMKRVTNLPKRTKTTKSNKRKTRKPMPPKSKKLRRKNLYPSICSLTSFSHSLRPERSLLTPFLLDTSRNLSLSYLTASRDNFFLTSLPKIHLSWTTFSTTFTRSPSLRFSTNSSASPTTTALMTWLRRSRKSNSTL